MKTTDYPTHPVAPARAVVDEFMKTGQVNGQDVPIELIPWQHERDIVLAQRWARNGGIFESQGCSCPIHRRIKADLIGGDKCL